MGGSGADNDPDSVPTPSLVTVAEAARLSGRSTEALRKAIGRGRLKARRSNNGSWLIELPAGQEQDSGPDLSDLLRDKLTEAKVAQARAEASLAAHEIAPDVQLSGTVPVPGLRSVENGVELLA